MAIHCPVDGAPRKITSGFHNRRGHRRHSSLDFYSHTGEPVRATYQRSDVTSVQSGYSIRSTSGVSDPHAAAKTAARPQIQRV